MEDAVYRDLMNYALRALTRRAHTTFELREKLKKRPNSTPTLENQVIARLIDLGLLNDEAYLRTAIDSATRVKPQGRFKLANKLYRKGIPMKDTEQVWKEMEIDEKALALDALARAHKRFAKVPPEKLYQKRAQFLASRGFSPEVIFELAKSEETP